MDSSKRDTIEAHIRSQFVRGEAELEATIKDYEGNRFPQRSAYLVVDKFIREYIKNKDQPNWIAVPGLRGIGKTTLLAQLYTSLKWARGYKLYLSLDRLKDLGVTLSEVLAVYEELIGIPFEKLEKRVILFLDEVQYEPNWGLALKILTDKTKNVFVFCTGSSALHLQTNADVGRRITYVKLHPLSFIEYILIKDAKKPVFGLGSRIRDAIFLSSTAEEVYQKLKLLEPLVRGYWIDIDKIEVDNYLKYGTIPFTLTLPDEALIYTRVNQSLTTVLTGDVPQIYKFTKSTVDRLSQVLYTVASSDLTVLTKLAPIIGVEPKTMIEIFNALEKTEILIRVYPYGSHYKQIKKPSKYLFSSPAHRAMYYNLLGSVIKYENYKGKLLEDFVGMYLTRIFQEKYALTYDIEEGGADFILVNRFKEEDKIAIEVGFSSKGCKQCVKTLSRLGGRFGLSISESRLTLHEEEKCISVPLEYFLLI